MESHICANKNFFITPGGSPFPQNPLNELRSPVLRSNPQCSDDSCADRQIRQLWPDGLLGNLPPRGYCGQRLAIITSSATMVRPAKETLNGTYSEMLPFNGAAAVDVKG